MSLRFRRGVFSAGLLICVAAAVSPSVLRAQSPGRARLVTGVTYTIRVGGPRPVGDGMIASIAAPPVHYVATAVFVAGRGRLDIIDGGVESLFGKGDYVLFDTTDLVIVHPATREFVVMPKGAGGEKLDQLEAMGMKATIGDVKVTIDSLSGTDTIAGHATSHFRMMTAFTMTIEAGVMHQRLATVSTTDYWVATVPGLPGNPLLRANGFSGAPAAGGMFRELSSRVDSAAARMGTAVALRTVTSSRLMQGLGSSVQMEQTSEVSDLRTGSVDERLLIVPAGFKQGVLPGMEAEPVVDVGAKWKSLPVSRPPTR
jgi:hypothetical protein